MKMSYKLYEDLRSYFQGIWRGIFPRKELAILHPSEPIPEQVYDAGRDIDLIAAKLRALTDQSGLSLLLTGVDDETDCARLTMRLAVAAKKPNLQVILEPEADAYRAYIS